MAKHSFLIAYPGRWVWLNREWIPTKTVTAPVVAEIEEAYMVGEVAESVVILPRFGKWVSVVAPDISDGKVVSVMPKDKFKDNAELLIANSVDEVADGEVPAWVINTTGMDFEIDRFESLAEVVECEVLESGNDDEREEGEKFLKT